MTITLRGGYSERQRKQARTSEPQACGDDDASHAGELSDGDAEGGCAEDGMREGVDTYGTAGRVWPAAYVGQR